MLWRNLFAKAQRRGYSLLKRSSRLWGSPFRKFFTNSRYSGSVFKADEKSKLMFFYHKWIECVHEDNLNKNNICSLQFLNWVGFSLFHSPSFWSTTHFIDPMLRQYSRGIDKSKTMLVLISLLSFAPWIANVWNRMRPLMLYNVANQSFQFFVIALGTIGCWRL